MRADQFLINRDEALSALGWWQEAGVDTLIDEAPRDWLTPPGKPATPAVAAPAQPELPDNLAAFTAWLAQAETLPGAPGDRLAPIGNPEAGLMLLVDMPEEGDAAGGALLSGEVGRLFDRMLAAIGRDRASIYLAPLSPARPIGGRIEAETIDELARFARHHVALARPRALLLMGDAPSRVFLGTGFVEARGRLHRLNDDAGTVAVATFHPRTLLQYPAQKARAWQDLRLLMGALA